MKQFNRFSVLFVAVLVMLTSCNGEDEKFDIDYAEPIPSVEKTTIAVGEEIGIEFSSTDTYEFYYEIADGSNNIEVFEQGENHYIRGKEVGIATIILTNNVGTNELTISVNAAPSIDTSNIYVGDSVLILNSDLDEGFSYEVTEGSDYIEVVEELVGDDNLYFIKGGGVGTAALTLTKNFGSNTFNINVISEVEKTGDYYVDYQGIRYNIDLDNDTASVAGKIDDIFVGANSDVDFSSVGGVITIPANIYYDGKEYPVKSIEAYAFYDDIDIKGNPTVKELHFAEGSELTSVATFAFIYCNNLTSVNFSGCS